MRLLSQGLSVLGDGAEWIWDLAEDHFHGSANVLDFWHAAEHLAAAGRAGLGETPAMQQWLKEAKRQAAANGYHGAVEVLRRTTGEDGVMKEAVVAELNYFAGQKERMNYAVRLRRDQALGSGAVEGAIKQLVNLRIMAVSCFKTHKPACHNSKRIGSQNYPASNTKLP